MEDASQNLIGSAVARREDDRLVTGRGRFVDDLVVPNQAHGAFVRSSRAHARIANIDTAAANATPGVLAVITGAQLDALGVRPLSAGAAATTGDAPKRPARWPLAKEMVRHVGEPMALVVAENAATAREAAEAIEVDYEETACVVDAEAARATGAPQLHDSVPGNLCYRWEAGDASAVERAFAAAAHVVSLRLRNNRLAVNPLETRAVVAAPDDAHGRVTVYTASQGVHALRTMLAETLDRSEASIRVVTQDVGGSFGMKMYADPEHISLVAAAQMLGRPVRWTAARSEGFVSDHQARDQVNDGELALDADGRFLALRVRSIANVGAYLSPFAAAIPTTIGNRALLGPYRTPAVHVAVDVVFSNTVPVDAYRGAGRPEATYVMERLVDEAARTLGFDRPDLRRRNLIPPEAMPYETPMGAVYDSGDFPAQLQTALEASDWDGFAARRRASEAAGLLRGLGLACFVEPAGGGRDQHAEARLQPDGSVQLLMGSQSTGMGHETVYAQLASERLGVPIDRIQVVQGDSDSVASGSWTSGSRGLTDGGSAALAALDRILDKATVIAAYSLEAAAADIEFADGQFRVRGTDRVRTLAEVASASYDHRRLPPGLEPGLSERAVYVGTEGTFPNGCHVCEVEIDPDTGRVAVVAYVAVDDFGRVVNPLVVEGQVHGGLAQGIGQALLETVVYDEGGQLLSGSLMDYTLPRADDLPGFALEHKPTRARSNPLGAKGCGESGTIGAPPTVMSAVLDALGAHDVRHLDMPATPERVWRALQKAAGNHGGSPG